MIFLKPEYNVVISHWRKFMQHTEANMMRILQLGRIWPGKVFFHGLLYISNVIFKYM